MSEWGLRGRFSEGLRAEPMEGFFESEEDAGAAGLFEFMGRALVDGPEGGRDLVHKQDARCRAPSGLGGDRLQPKARHRMPSQIPYLHRFVAPRHTH